EFAERDAELAVDAKQPAFFQFVQPPIIDHRRNIERAIDGEAGLLLRYFLAQARQQPIEEREGHVGRYPALRLAVPWPVPDVERPQRGKAREREFDDLRAGTHMLPQRRIVPQVNVLDQQDIAGLEIADREFLQISGQWNEMVFGLEFLVERCRVVERLRQG